MSVYRLFLTLALGSGVLAAFGTNISQAHYLWLRSDISDKEPRLVLYLSEAADLPGDVLPEPIALTPVSWQSFDGPPVAVDMRPLKEDALEVHSPAIEQDSGGVATAVCKFGIFRGRRLTYFAKHVACTDWNQLESPLASKEFLIDLAPHVRGGRLMILATFQGKPLPHTEIRYMAASGKETTPRTDEQGRLEIELPNDGPVSFMLRHKQEEPTGRIGEQEYQGASDYVTLTLSPPSSAAKPADDSASALPKLPEPVASFGAAVAGDWLYVYGGHVGKTHQHSADNLSQHFRRLHLRKPKQWEELPMQTPLQGMCLLSDGKRLYRIGGLTAMNSANEPEQLNSVKEAAMFDPAQAKWAPLPDLPEPRSSHDAVILDGHIYVIGGWSLEAGEKPRWLSTAWSLELNDPTAVWQPLSDAPFQRRALAVGHWQGKLVALGGMNSDHDVSRRVDIYDPREKKWLRGPDLPPSKLKGFGMAACHHGGRLYVSGNSSRLSRLSDDGREWVAAVAVKRPRFFHRLVAVQAGKLLAIAGASHEQGHLDDVECIQLKP